MVGITTTLTAAGFDEAISKLGMLASFDMAELSADAGAILESSTKRRFEIKRGPDGSAWADWSPEYAATRGDHHSLLVGENDLLTSIQSYATGTEAIVGSNLIYAAIQNLGGEEVGKNIPAREFLGVSDEDIIDLRHLVTGRLEDMLQ